MRRLFILEIVSGMDSKIKRMSGKKINKFIVLTVLLLAVLLFLFTSWKVSDNVPEIISIWIICSGSVLLLLYWSYSIGKLQCVILYAGYVIRCICMLIDVYGRNYIMLFRGGCRRLSSREHQGSGGGKGY